MGKVQRGQCHCGRCISDRVASRRGDAPSRQVKARPDRSKACHICFGPALLDRATDEFDSPHPQLVLHGRGRDVGDESASFCVEPRTRAQSVTWSSVRTEDQRTLLSHSGKLPSRRPDLHTMGWSALAPSS
jgi:hypothetical protein